MTHVIGIARNSQNSTAKVAAVVDDVEKDEAVDENLETILDDDDDCEEADIVDTAEVLVFAAFRFVVVGTFRNFVAVDMVKDCVGYYKGLKVR